MKVKNFLYLKWDAESHAVMKEMVFRWSQDDYNDFTKRKEHQTTLKAEWDAYQYGRDRVVDYPTMQEQADMQYHDELDGTTTWKDAVEAVKTKWPKDNSGPV